MLENRDTQSQRRCAGTIRQKIFEDSCDLESDVRFSVGQEHVLVVLPNECRIQSWDRRTWVRGLLCGRRRPFQLRAIGVRSDRASTQAYPWCSPLCRLAYPIEIACVFWNPIEMNPVDFRDRVWVVLLEIIWAVLVVSTNFALLTLASD